MGCIMGLWRQIRVLHYRNTCIRRHQWLASLFEILLPTLAFALVAYTGARNTFEHITTNETIWPTYSDDFVTKNGFWNFKDVINIVYTPQSRATQRLVNEMVSILQDKTKDTDRKFNVSTADSEEEIKDIFRRKFFHPLRDLAPGFGIHFTNINPNTPEELPTNLEFVIRPVTSMLETDQLFISTGLQVWDVYPAYLSFGFVGINLALNEAFLRLTARDAGVSVPRILIKQFPSPRTSQDVAIFKVTDFLPGWCMFLVTLIFLFILKNVISEKETGAKELMKMMGLKGWMNWLGWIMGVLMTSIFAVTICVFLLTVSIFGQPPLLASATVLWVFLMLYIYAAIGYAFCLCPMFKRPTLAICIANVLWPMTGIAYKLEIPEDSDFGFLDKYLYLIPNVALRRGWDTFSYFEKRGGAHWSDLFTRPSSEHNFSLAFVFGSFILQCFIFGTIAWYLDAVWPGPYGIPETALFFLKKSYWWSNAGSKEREDDWDPEKVKNFERVPPNLKPGIKVRNLRKSFKKFVAVNDVSINFYEGEITALLGHNGAGKTTTMSMLTGMIPSDAGRVIVDGYNIFDNMSQFRQNLGLCPQHNLLFSTLTVMEHLTFFGLLKGLSKQQAHTEALHLMELQNISIKCNDLPDKLSGGMKRKLSLAIALIGSPKILMLDEPTSGMDPESRREMWNLLLSIRGERTIILTTHFMEEADVLGDRIAIMDHGQVMCFGTSIMLKNLYGAGYYLNILKKREAGQNRDEITAAIHEYVSEAELKSDEGPKLTYVIPIESVDALSDMFEQLESLKDELGIASMAVACTTLEEVFLKVGEIADGERGAVENGTVNQSFELDNSVHNASSEVIYRDEKDYTKKRSMALLWQQFTSLMKRKLIYSCRRRKMYLIFGIVVLLASLLASSLMSGQKNAEVPGQPALPLKPVTYRSMRVQYRSADSNPYVAQLEELAKPQTTLKISSDEDLDTYLLSQAYRDIREYYYKNMMVLDVNSTSLIVFHNPVAQHSLPICVNLAYNLILKATTGRTISAVNHPVNLRRRDFCHLTSDEKMKLVVSRIFILFQFFGTTMLVLSGSFIALPIQERLNNAKQLQLMTGAPSTLYWFTMFFVDYSYYILISVLSVLIFLFKENYTAGEAAVLFLITALAGLSNTLFSYGVAFFYESYANAFSFHIKVNLILGTYGGAIMYALMTLNGFPHSQLVDGPWLDLADGVLRLLPQYSFTFSLTSFVLAAYQKDVCRTCSESECQKMLFIRDMEVQKTSLKYNLTSLALSGLLQLALIFLMESERARKLRNFVFISIIGSELEDKKQTDEDPDVQEEREKIDAAKNHPEHRSEYVLLVERLVKKFSRSSAGVRGVSFGVRAGECFGLLGVNGAGKTTTFRMLTGDTLPTAGDCSVHSVRLSRDARRYLAQIGYCPQVDGINEYLTGQELLRHFANLRGVHRYQIDQEVARWVTTMGLSEYASKLSGTYSGGNKRKLSTAMALIGEPNLVVLDEPTSGVDPISRRKLWDILIEARKRGQAIVFTSHSMDECETLCDRLTIMAGGKLMCIGNVEYLKQRYAQGYTIQLKLSGAPQTELTAVKRAVEQAFEGAMLKDEHAGSLRYHITTPTVALSALFNKMREIKGSMNVVEDYQVCNTTLEQVFLAFARSEAKIVES
ncbi:unnamed protein product [Bemisia tabaci]|uniref:ABC transporter domain-containing protein n=1 Tax=Bemisia tabaci TaxID=7038 RepID=A0A9P0A6Y6_BEMTA|nr:unnamed protein product [Bemisia tabaci]